ncbi:MAG: hypothetical protein J6568_06925 [Snodgrassella sp.]|nr:hypothetical protein [Snodgrassella sp.]
MLNPSKQLHPYVCAAHTPTYHPVSHFCTLRPQAHSITLKYIQPCHSQTT